MADKEVLGQLNRWEQFNAIADNLDLDLKEKGLLMILFRFVNYKTGYADPSRALIKKLTKITDNRTLDKLLNNLIDKGLLDRESQKGKRSRYFVKVGGEITPSVKNVPSVEVTPLVGGEITPLVAVKVTPQKENKRKVKENIYSSLENELDTKEVEKDLINKINSKYSKDLIKEELEKLKDKDISKLDLLKELDKNLKSKIKDNSNKDIEEIWSLYPLKKGKASAIKKIPKLLKEYGKEQIIRCIDRYIKYVDNQRKNGFSTLKYKDGSTFFNSGYMDYLDCNYQEDIITKPKEESKRRGTNLDDL